jgi:hypothetical protein
MPRHSPTDGERQPFAMQIGVAIAGENPRRMENPEKIPQHGVG